MFIPWPNKNYTIVVDIQIILNFTQLSTVRQIFQDQKYIIIT